MAKQEEKTAIQVDINLDTTPILYTDNILMSTNQEGVVLDIAQKLGPSNKVRIVSRVGMSREHAKKLVAELGRLLAMTDGQIQTGSN
jgi:hypothetical protein